jgi:hypothetical protein
VHPLSADTAELAPATNDRQPWGRQSRGQGGRTFRPKRRREGGVAEMCSRISARPLVTVIGSQKPGGHIRALASVHKLLKSPLTPPSSLCETTTSEQVFCIRANFDPVLLNILLVYPETNHLPISPQWVRLTLPVRLVVVGANIACAGPGCTCSCGSTCVSGGFRPVYDL